jgi:choline dehydrogenase-like flavoprotein
LLNSKSAAFLNGLANSSGQVGRNLTDSVSTAVSGVIPALQGLPPFNDDGTSIGHAYVPWWGHREKAAGRLRFATEYHINMIGGRSMPSVDMLDAAVDERGKPLYGQALRERMRRDYGSKLSLLSFGGMIPNADCYCDIDPAAKDRWGIPVLRFHWKRGAQEVEQAQHAVASMSEMISAMGGKPSVYTGANGNVMAEGGGIAHEVGTARMGATAAHSVLNSFGRCWYVRNVYVADGAAFAGHADKNPTETIMALAWRASDNLADRFVRKEL